MRDFLTTGTSSLSFVDRVRISASCVTTTENAWQYYPIFMRRKAQTRTASKSTKYLPLSLNKKYATRSTPPLNTVDSLPTNFYLMESFHG